MLTFAQFQEAADVHHIHYTMHPASEFTEKPWQKHDHIVAAWDKNHSDPIPQAITSKFLNSIKKPKGMSLDNLVGYVVADGHGNGTHTPKQVFVHEKRRRQGIATGMYKHYTNYTGNKYLESGNKTTDGDKFRKSVKLASTLG